eukprot:TRINITY_DN34947_c2_g1_i1.p2 TRINITY_DN34947_c2_g1~~TRINITY_DN34947_c2_g1_i1.p2  ORF type:complete len:189 (+),score=-21.79 TRINITY_DN34947_c2_g1_i1:481-1047(+)
MLILHIYNITIIMNKGRNQVNCHCHNYGKRECAGIFSFKIQLQDLLRVQIPTYQHSMICKYLRICEIHSYLYELRKQHEILIHIISYQYFTSQKHTFFHTLLQRCTHVDFLGKRQQSYKFPGSVIQTKKHCRKSSLDSLRSKNIDRDIIYSRSQLRLQSRNLSACIGNFRKHNQRSFTSFKVWDKCNY